MSKVHLKSRNWGKHTGLTMVSVAVSVWADPCAVTMATGGGASSMFILMFMFCWKTVGLSQQHVMDILKSATVSKHRQHQRDQIWLCMFYLPIMSNILVSRNNERWSWYRNVWKLILWKTGSPKCLPERVKYKKMYREHYKDMFNYLACAVAVLWKFDLYSDSWVSFWFEILRF